MLYSVPVRMALVPTLLLNLTVGPTILHAQQPTAVVPSITIRTSTRLVVVDVVVTDKKGQPITGLKPDDFTVEENGKKQKVAIFTPPGSNQGSPQSPPSGVLSNRPEFLKPAGAPTVLVLDAANSPFKDQAYGRSQMLKYVLEQSHAGTPMAVMALTDQLRMFQNFTTDPKILTTAIKNLQPEQPILQPVAPLEASGSNGGDSGLHGGMAAAIAVAQNEVANFANLTAGYDLERRTLITIEAMRSLSRMLGGLPGRKNVVWLTASLPFDLIPEDRAVSDAELMADLPGQGRQRSVGVNAAGSQAAEQRMMHAQEIRDAETRLASANIAIYPVDLRGLVGGMESLAAVSYAHSNDIHGAGIANSALAQSGGLQTSQDTMREIAAETGGKVYINENEIKEGIALAAADDKASYSIGYYPENKKWDGKYRSIKIKVAQGDTQVRHRKGYFAVDPTQAKDANYDRDVAAALAFNAPATQISFMAQAKPGDPGKVRVVFLVDAHTLSAEDSGGNKKMNVSLYASVYGSNGKSLGTRSIKVDRAFDAATYQQILEKGMMVPIDLDVPSGGKELRLAVLDNKTGLIGTVSGPLGQ